MARRKKTSALDDLVELVAMLPWWACLGLALASYLLLSALARPVVVTGAGPGAITQMATQAMWKAFAFAGQFIVPLACVIAAGVSASRRHERGQLVSRASTAGAPAALPE